MYSLFLRRGFGDVCGGFHVQGVILPDKGETSLQVGAVDLCTDLGKILQRGAVRVAVIVIKTAADGHGPGPDGLQKGKAVGGVGTVMPGLEKGGVQRGSVGVKKALFGGFLGVAGVQKTEVTGGEQRAERSIPLPSGKLSPAAAVMISAPLSAA